MPSLDEANTQGLVIGLKDVASIRNRLDIDVLLYNFPKTFNLLLIALKELKCEKVPWDVDADFKVTTNDKMSFYQIAGIHGLPRAPWDKERGRKPTSNSDPGYCVHGSPAFGPWHRPYLAMLEQSLYRQMSNVVDRFSRSTKLKDAEKQAYKDALKEFRLPYWDYYRPRGGPRTIPGVGPNDTTTTRFDYSVPMIFTAKQVMIYTLPDNEPKPLDNPFFNYQFAPSDMSATEWTSVPGFTTSSVERSKTVRWGGDNEQSIKIMNDGINKVREDQVRVSLVMIEDSRPDPKSYTNFLNFATDGIGLIGDLDGKKLIKGPLFDRTGSIEGVHNNYHCYIGGSSNTGASIGHMICVPVAAFDPVFWAHHCNIDRLFATWQAVNPDHWFDDIPADHAIKTRNGSFKTGWRSLATSSQLPFRKALNPAPKDANDKWQFWTADEARFTETFGYRYPDVDPTRYNSPEQIRQGFADRYSWNRRLTPYQDILDPPADMLPLPIEKAQCYQYNIATPAIAAVKQVSMKMATQVKSFSLQAQTAFLEKPKLTISREWFIDTVVERMALDGAFTIFFIVGEVAGDSAAEWMALPGYVGVAHVFAAPSAVCDNCEQQSEQSDRVTNTTSMTSLLLDYVEHGQLDSMDPADVEPFLVKNLRWRVQKSGGDVVDPRDMSNNYSFRIGISLKTSPLPGEQGVVQVTFHEEIIQQIISNAS